MTFIFNPTLTDNLSLVRFHVGDCNPDGYYLEDETIQYFVTASGVPTAVIRCIQYIITQLSQPDFRLDWLSVSNGVAIESFRKLLKEKSIELGVSVTGAVASSTISLPYRADSYQASATDVHDGTP